MTLTRISDPSRRIESSGRSHLGTRARGVGGADEHLEHAAKLGLVAEDLRAAARLDRDARARRDFPEQRRQIDATAPAPRRAAGVERGEHLHGVVERVELGLDARRRRARLAADLGRRQNRDALPKFLGGAARFLREKPGQLLPGQPVAVHVSSPFESRGPLCQSALRAATVRDTRGERAFAPAYMLPGPSPMHRLRSAWASWLFFPRLVLGRRQREPVRSGWRRRGRCRDADGGAADARTTDGPIFGSPVSTTASVTTASIARSIPATTIFGAASSSSTTRAARTASSATASSGAIPTSGAGRVDPRLQRRQTCTIDTCVEATRSVQARAARRRRRRLPPTATAWPAATATTTIPPCTPAMSRCAATTKTTTATARSTRRRCQKPTHDTCLDPLVDRPSRASTSSTPPPPPSTTPARARRWSRRRARTWSPRSLLTGGPLDADIVAEAPGGTVAVGARRRVRRSGERDRVRPRGARRARATSSPACAARSLPAGNFPVYVWADRDEKVRPARDLGAADRAARPTKRAARRQPHRARHTGHREPRRNDARPRVALRLRGRRSGLPVRSTRSVDVTAYAASTRRLRRPRRLDPPRSVLGARGRDRVRLRSAGAELRARAAERELLRRGLGERPDRRAARGRCCRRRRLRRPTRPARRARARSQPHARRVADRAHRRHRPRLRAHRLGRRRLRARSRARIGRAARRSASRRATRAPFRSRCRAARARVHAGLRQRAKLADSRIAARRRRRDPTAPSSRPCSATPSSSPRSCAPPCRRRSSRSPTRARRATTIPESGGFFQGTPPTRPPTTRRVRRHGRASGGRRRPDAEVHAEPEEARRVRHAGSSYSTLLDVRRGETCPGLEMPTRARRATSALRELPRSHARSRDLLGAGRRLCKRRGDLVPRRARRGSVGPTRISIRKLTARIEVPLRWRAFTCARWGACLSSMLSWATRLHGDSGWRASRSPCRPRSAPRTRAAASSRTPRRQRSRPAASSSARKRRARRASLHRGRELLVIDAPPERCRWPWTTCGPTGKSSPTPARCAGSACRARGRARRARAGQRHRPRQIHGPRAARAGQADSSAATVRFWLDHRYAARSSSTPTASSIVEARGDKTLLTYLVMVDLGPGIFARLFEGKVEAPLSRRPPWSRPTSNRTARRSNLRIQSVTFRASQMLGSARRVAAIAYNTYREAVRARSSSGSGARAGDGALLDRRGEFALKECLARRGRSRRGVDLRFTPSSQPSSSA